MILLIGFSFLAGVVTVLSPCIFPVLPFLLSGGVSGGKRRPFGIILGFITSFTFFTLTLSTIVRLTAIPADFLRGFAVILLGIFGLFLLVPKLQVWFEIAVSRFIPKGKHSSQNNKEGFVPGVLIGLSLGLVWTPCVGPILASVVTLAASSSVNAASVFITLAYSLGTGIPMLGIMLGGRTIVERFSWFKTQSARIQKSFGMLIIVMAIVMSLGFDRKFEAWVLDKFPNYGESLISIEDTESVQNQLDRLKK